mmetsp:Transcript_42161/g.126247  ORF Transcript_42161/g.126247 Transcript_42161/m.126247 type:complete len:134 (-) Transcript_42161:857-1258(-)
MLWGGSRDRKHSVGSAAARTRPTPTAVSAARVPEAAAVAAAAAPEPRGRASSAQALGEQEERQQLREGQLHGKDRQQQGRLSRGHQLQARNPRACVCMDAWACPCQHPHSSRPQPCKSTLNIYGHPIWLELDS